MAALAGAEVQADLAAMVEAAGAEVAPEAVGNTSIKQTNHSSTIKNKAT